MSASALATLRKTVAGLAADYRQTDAPALVMAVPEVVNGTWAAQWAARNDQGLFRDARTPVVAGSPTADFVNVPLSYTVGSATLTRKVGPAIPVPDRLEDALSSDGSGVDVLADATLKAQQFVWGQIRDDIQTALIDGSTGLEATSAGSGTLALTTAGSLSTVNIVDFFATIVRECAAYGVKGNELTCVLPMKAIDYLLLHDQVQAGTAIAIGSSPTSNARRTGSAAPESIAEFFKSRFKFKDVLVEDYAEINTSGNNALAGEGYGYVMRSGSAVNSAAITIYQPAPGGSESGLAGNAGACALYVRATAGTQAPGFVVASDAQYTIQVRNKYAGRRFAITYS